ncbi:hypothetical protein HED60_21870 [Planctomycetales bacterium ZRK34]|nr:hypothetical protein HED60_21870 [Planctomycetales bacterium ZRK34]
MKRCAMLMLGVCLLATGCQQANQSADDYVLPAWYEQYRVHAHTRLSPNWRDKPIFLEAGHKLHDLGFHVITRHIKTGHEGAWWPSEVGAVEPWAQQTDYAQKIIDEAHDAGSRIIVYHRHMEDAAMAVEHPDWICVHPDGKPALKRRGLVLCMNSPYPDFVLTRLKELAARGADGFYFDEMHMPKDGCWCDYCRKRFTDETGLNPPAKIDPADPVYQKYIDFNNETIRRTFARWRKALHADYPKLVILIGSNSYPAMTERHTTDKLYRIADAMKTEYSLPARRGPNRIFTKDKSMVEPDADERQALGWALSRDAAEGRPPHVWAHGLVNDLHARFATAALITHGCIANLDNNEKNIPDAELFAGSTELGNRVSPAFAGARPLRWAAVHHNEAARDALLPDESAAWKQVLYPTFGAYRALLKAHVPVGVVTDSLLEDGRLDGYKLLFLPSENLTAKQKANVEAFKRRGGVVVTQQPQWQWHTSEGMAAATGQFMQQIGGVLPTAPVVVTGGADRMQTDVFTADGGKCVTVAAVNDFSWVYTGRLFLRNGKPATKIDPRTIQPPAPCRNVVIHLKRTDKPRSARDLASGKTLTVTQEGDGYAIALPDFECMAAVVVTYDQ